MKWKTKEKKHITRELGTVKCSKLKNATSNKKIQYQAP